MKSNRLYLLILSILILSSCMKGKHVDLIIHNAQIHTLDEKNSIENAIAINDGKIVEVGPERQILNKYSSDEAIDAGGKDIYPSFTDVRANIIEYALQKTNLDLTGTKSFDELIVRTEKYKQRNPKKFIIGYGLNENIWTKDSLKSLEEFSRIFSNNPICIHSSDRKYVFVNKKMLSLIQQNNSVNQNGIFEYKEFSKFKYLLPKANKKAIMNTILEIQDELLQYGITQVNESNLSFENIDIFKQLVRKNKLRLNIYGMLAPSENNFSFAKKHPTYQFKNLSIRSFDITLDDNESKLLYSSEELKRIALVCELSGYQLRASVYSTLALNQVTPFIESLNVINKDHRSSLEKLSFLSKKELKKLSELSIYPTLVPNEPDNYSEYKSLLTNTTMMSFGSNFPYSNMDPFWTIHQLTNGQTTNSSNTKQDEMLSIDEAIKGMTIWAAYSRFQENTQGTLEKGKDANLVVFENPVSYSPTYNSNFAYLVFIKGKKVYSVE